MNSLITDEILARLARIERNESVRIIYACESGSRAWGFASTDSDYDVRFIYVRPLDWYLSVDVEDKRDVIELPIDGAFDINGWDLRKALQLLRKSNPPLLEWLRSPIVYRESPDATRMLRAIVDRYFCPTSCAYHYFNMARNNYRDYLRGDEVSLKKYLYALRPLLAVQWIERGLGPVPTEFQQLFERLVVDAKLQNAVEELLARKQNGVEMGKGPRIAAISEFVENELKRLESGILTEKQEPAPTGELNRIFREMVRGA